MRKTKINFRDEPLDLSETAKRIEARILIHSHSTPASGFRNGHATGWVPAKRALPGNFAALGKMIDFVCTDAKFYA
jgi:hypothetical protein